MVLLSRAEKEKVVLDLYSQGKTYKQIAQEVRISPRDIGIILNKAAAQEKEKEKGQGETNKQNQMRIIIIIVIHYQQGPLTSFQKVKVL
jgi:FixJ family two-component response regulator